MHPFHEHVGGDAEVPASNFDDCRIVSYALMCGGLCGFQATGQVVDKTELAQLLQICTFRILVFKHGTKVLFLNVKKAMIGFS
jgi:hypothetical protein